MTEVGWRNQGRSLGRVFRWASGSRKALQKKDTEEPANKRSLSWWDLALTCLDLSGFPRHWSTGFSTVDSLIGTTCFGVHCQQSLQTGAYLYWAYAVRFWYWGPAEVMSVSRDPALEQNVYEGAAEMNPYQLRAAPVPCSTVLLGWEGGWVEGGFSLPLVLIALVC